MEKFLRRMKRKRRKDAAIKLENETEVDDAKCAEKTFPNNTESKEHTLTHEYSVVPNEKPTEVLTEVKENESVAVAAEQQEENFVVKQDEENNRPVHGNDSVKTTEGSNGEEEEITPLSLDESVDGEDEDLLGLWKSRTFLAERRCLRLHKTVLELRKIVNVVHVELWLASRKLRHRNRKTCNECKNPRRKYRERTLARVRNGHKLERAEEDLLKLKVKKRLRFK